MTPTDELIAALLALASDFHEPETNDGHDWKPDPRGTMLAEAADRLASLTAPVEGVTLTSDDLREAYECWSAKGKGPRIVLNAAETIDRLYSALAAKDYLLRLCEEQHHRDEAALSAERDQNKRLVDLLRLVNSASYSSDTHSFNEAMTAVADYLGPIFAAERAALAQPEEQR